jgi:hypothetical protein
MPTPRNALENSALLRDARAAALATGRVRQRRPLRWAAVLALLGVLLTCGVAWAQPSGVVVSEGTLDGRARMVVSGDGPIAVTVDGRPQPITTTPLVSERAAMALVVDASAEGGPGLQPGLGGLVDFALGAPSGTRTAVVSDTAPPAVVVPLQAGPAGVLTGLGGITSRGDRQTGAALDLAVAQLPREPDSPRLVVLYTGGTDTADAADALAARLRAEGVVLAVVTTADAGYWRAVAEGTGGVAVGAPPSAVVAGFGQVASALRTRSLVTLPAPERASTPAVVSVGGQSAETVLPPEAAGVDPMIVAAGVVAGLVALALAAVALVRLARRRRPAHEWAAPTAARERSPVQAPEQATSTAERERTPVARAPERAAPPTERGRRPVEQAPERAAPPVERGRRGRRLRRVWHAPERPAMPTVDRRRLRMAIEDAVTLGGQAVVRPADGRAGNGVTTALVDFAHHYREAYDVTWWITAQDPQLIGDQMARLAEALGVAAPTDSADAATAAALAALRQRGRWLLVFDDAGPPHDLARFLPGGTGHVLVGSTDPGWEGRSVAVPPFRRAESVELLRAHHGDLTAAEADRVATALADVPLDVAAAGATLGATGMSADNFLAALGEDATTDRPKREAAAWAVAFDRLAADEPQALALLTLVAWLDPESVPTVLLTGPLPPALTTSDTAQLVAVLVDRGVARADGDNVQLHHVPAAHLVRHSADDRPDGAGWAVWAVRLLRAAAPPDPDDPATWPAWRGLMPHVLAATDPGRALDEVAVEVGWLLHHAARFLRARGEQESARALLEDAHDLYRRRLGPDDPQTIAAARALADNLRALGRHEEARLVLEDLRG